MQRRKSGDRAEEEAEQNIERYRTKDSRICYRDENKERHRTKDSRIVKEVKIKRAKE